MTQGFYLLRLRRSFQILPNDSRMASGDPKQCNRRTVRFAPILFPVAERMHANPNRFRKFGLPRKGRLLPGGTPVVRSLLSGGAEKAA